MEALQALPGSQTPNSKLNPHRLSGYHSGTTPPRSPPVWVNHKSSSSSSSSISNSNSSCRKRSSISSSSIESSSSSSSSSCNSNSRSNSNGSSSSSSSSSSSVESSSRSSSCNSSSKSSSNSNSSSSRSSSNSSSSSSSSSSGSGSRRRLCSSPSCAPCSLTSAGCLAHSSSGSSIVVVYAPYLVALPVASLQPATSNGAASSAAAVLKAVVVVVCSLTAAGYPAHESGRARDGRHPSGATSRRSRRQNAEASHRCRNFPSRS